MRMCVTVFSCINISASHLCAVWAVHARSASHHCSALRIFFIRKITSAQTQVMNNNDEWLSFIRYCKEWSDQRLVRRQSKLLALHVVFRLYHQTKLEEQVLLSSRLLAHHTHTQKPYSELFLCANGSRFRGCHPFHFLLSVLSQPLRLAQTLISLPIFQDKRMSLQWDFV